MQGLVYGILVEMGMAEVMLDMPAKRGNILLNKEDA